MKTNEKEYGIGVKQDFHLAKDFMILLQKQLQGIFIFIFILNIKISIQINI